MKLLLGLRCALYVRWSTEDQEDSFEVQTGEGTAFIEAEGGHLDKAHIFHDEARSRAEFKKRSGLHALLRAALAGAFDAVIVRDETRLGGDTFRAGLMVQDLLEAGVQLFYYYTRERVKLDSALDKLLLVVRNFAAESEREKTSQRTHEHLMTKARKGLVVGGRVYGYDNVEIANGDQRLRVEYRINEVEAAIVREIFRRYADGEGLRAIAKDLNARGVTPPKAGTRGTGSWSYSSIREMVRRERYRGQLVWGKRAKAYRGGTKVRLPRPPKDWVTIEVPELRIVGDDLWFAVQARNEGRVRMSGSARRGPEPKYFLAGLGRCAECGGAITIANAKVSYENVRVYVCGRHRNQGDTGCKNTLRRPVAAVDRAVAEWLRDHALTEAVLLQVCQELEARMSSEAQAWQQELPSLEAKALTLKTELRRLGELALAADTPLETVANMIRERETELRDVNARMAIVRAAPSVLREQIRAVRDDALARLADFAGLVERNPQEARRALEALLGAPLHFTPVETAEGKRYHIEGEIEVGRLFTIEGVPSGIGTLGKPPWIRTLRGGVRMPGRTERADVRA